MASGSNGKNRGARLKAFRAGKGTPSKAKLRERADATQASGATPF